MNVTAHNAHQTQVPRVLLSACHRAASAWRRVGAPRNRPAVLAVLSHALVLSLGFVLVVPALAGGQRLETPAVARGWASAGVIGITPGRGANSVASLQLARERADTAPSTSPAPVVFAHAAPPAPAAPAPAAPANQTAAGNSFSPPPPGSGGGGVAAIYAAFNGSPGLTWALRVAKCESGYNPLAVNRYSGASGLFQFMPSTWNAHFPGWNIWDPNAQARAARVFYDHGWTSAWTCK